MTQRYKQAMSPYLAAQLKRDIAIGLAAGVPFGGLWTVLTNRWVQRRRHPAPMPIETPLADPDLNKKEKQAFDWSKVVGDYASAPRDGDYVPAIGFTAALAAAGGSALGMNALLTKLYKTTAEQRRAAAADDYKKVLKEYVRAAQARNADSPVVRRKFAAADLTADRIAGIVSGNTKEAGDKALSARLDKLYDLLSAQPAEKHASAWAHFLMAAIPSLAIGGVVGATRGAATSRLSAIDAGIKKRMQRAYVQPPAAVVPVELIAPRKGEDEKRDDGKLLDLPELDPKRLEDLRAIEEYIR